MKKNTLDYILIIIATLGWGCISLATRPLGIIGFSTLQITVLRLILSAIFMGLYLLIKNKHLFKIKSTHLPLFIVAGINFFCLIYLYITSIKQNNSSAFAAMLLYTSPIWIVVFSRIFFKEKVSLLKVCVLITTIGGLALIMLTQPVQVSLLGIVLGLLSGLSYGLYSILGKVLSKSYGGETNTFYTLLFSGVCAMYFLDIDHCITCFNSNRLNTILLFGLLVICMTILPYTLYTHCLKSVPVSLAGMLSILEPVIATISGIIFFNDPMSVWGYIGVVIIIGSLLILELEKNMKKDVKHDYKNK